MDEATSQSGPEALSQVSDLRGTPVVDVEDAAVGSVFGALAEVDSGLIRYIDVSIDDARKHVLVPIGHARVDRTEGGARMRLRAATVQDLDAVPTYDPAEGGIDEPFERSVLSSLGRLFYGERYYAHPAYDHNGLYAGDHPIVRVGDDIVGGAPAADNAAPAAAQTATPEPGAAAAAPSGDADLVPLARLDRFRIADGAPDVRGWDVVTGEGTVVGRVADLIVDTSAETIRYLVVTDETAAAGDGGTSALIPIGYTRTDRRRDRMELPVLTPADVDALRVYRAGEAVSRDVEGVVRDRIEAMLSGTRRFDRADFAADLRG